MMRKCLEDFEWRGERDGSEVCARPVWICNKRHFKSCMFQRMERPSRRDEEEKPKLTVLKSISLREKGYLSRRSQIGDKSERRMMIRGHSPSTN